MSNFSNYKKKRTDLTKLTEQIKNLDTPKNKFKDDRFWSPTIDKAGNGSALIRFLPAIDNDEIPWVKQTSHNFNIDDKYYIELCPTQINRECYACKENRKLWKTETKENQDIARQRGQRTSYIVNILILRDKENPETEGRVFLWKFGKKIYEKIKNQLSPKDEDEASVNVFDFYDGADFKLEIKKVAGYRNYDDSTFKNPSPLYKGDDNQIEKVYNSIYPLEPFAAESNYKSYEELEKKFREVTEDIVPSIKKKAEDLFNDEAPSAPPKRQRERKPVVENEEDAPWEEVLSKGKKEETVVDDDDDLNCYAALAEQD